MAQLYTTPVWLSPQPSDVKYVAWNYPLEYMQNTYYQPASGQLVTIKIPIYAAVLVKNIIIQVQNAGASLTAGQNLAALFSADGTTQYGITADQSAVWNSVGTKVMSISGPGVTVNPPFAIIALLSVGTTPVGLAKSTAITNAPPTNGNLASADVWRIGYGDATYQGLTAIPNPLVLSHMLSYFMTPWAALS